MSLSNRVPMLAAFAFWYVMGVIMMVKMVEVGLRLKKWENVSTTVSGFLMSAFFIFYTVAIIKGILSGTVPVTEHMKYLITTFAMYLGLGILFLCTYTFGQNQGQSKVNG